MCASGRDFEKRDAAGTETRGILGNTLDRIAEQLEYADIALHFGKKSWALHVAV